MRFKSLVCVAVLFGVVSLFTQATTDQNPGALPGSSSPEATPAPTPAPAPEAAPAPAPTPPAPELLGPGSCARGCPAPAPAPAAAPNAVTSGGVQTAIYGMGMFRLREIVIQYIQGRILRKMRQFSGPDWL